MLFALPVFAGIPTTENAPANSEEDAWFWLNSLSEEELIQIFGQVIKDDGSTADGAWESEDITDYEFSCRDQVRINLYKKLEAEVKAKFNWSNAFFNTLIGALTSVIAKLLESTVMNSLTSEVIGAAIITASATNPIIAAAIIGAGIGYLTYLVEYYFIK